MTSAAGRPRKTSTKTRTGQVSQRVCDTAQSASAIPATMPSAVEITDRISVFTRPVPISVGSDSTSSGQSRKFCRNAFMSTLSLRLTRRDEATMAGGYFIAYGGIGSGFG
ncbi:hypothetical protein OKW35_000250 [Paraburkholderia sp. MM5477-R1]